MAEMSNVLVKVRLCPCCKIEKQAEDFWRAKRTKDGLQIYCKSCTYQKRKENNNNVRASGRKWYHSKGKYLKQSQTYNISVEDLKALYENTKVCEICGKTEESKTSLDGHAYGLVVDHNHKTGELRGLLCRNCNSGIGLLQEKPEVLKLAIQYLEDRGY